MKPTSGGKRFLNLVVDYSLLPVILRPVLIGLFSPASYTDYDRQMFSLELMFYVVIGNLLILEWLTGKTVGKYLTKTKVVTKQGNRASFFKILLRFIIRMIPLESFSFVFSRNPIGWHDSISGTLVIDDEQSFKLAKEKHKQNKSSDLSLIKKLTQYKKEVKKDSLINTPLIIVVILMGGGLFYWFQVRPTKIRQQCSWVKKYQDEIPAKPAMTEKELRSSGLLKECDRDILKEESNIFLRITQENNCIKNEKIIEQYKNPQLAVPAKDWLEKASEDEYQFCIRSKGIIK